MTFKAKALFFVIPMVTMLSLSLLAAWWGGRLFIRKPVATLVATARRGLTGRRAVIEVDGGELEINGDEIQVAYGPYEIVSLKVE